MSATMNPPRPQKEQHEGPGDRAASAARDEFARIRAENEQLRELVVQLSRLVVQNAIARK